MARWRIALVVQGRFHAFDLARALDARGHAVTVFTNYPRSTAPRFGLRPEILTSFVGHGAITRALAATPRMGRRAEPWLHESFGRWAARALAREEWDVVHCWSGVSEELLRSERVRAGARLLMRGSSHIDRQSRLLEEEERRTGVAIDRPSEWMRARERREYELADRIVVLSTFAAQSFTEHGIARERLAVLPLGVDLQTFRPAPGVLEARMRRIASGAPVNVLYVGTVSYQKGCWDLARVATALAGERFTFTVVGEVLPEVSRSMEQLATLPNVRVRGKLPQVELPSVYADADVFLFPTIQDGYAMVLAQAQAAGLPTIATANSAAPDIIRSGENGWVVNARDADAMVEHLRFCHERREELAAMAKRTYESFMPRDWTDVARDFETIVEHQAAPLATS